MHIEDQFHQMYDPKELKLIISELKIPHKLKNIKLNWKLFEMSLDEWGKSMDDHKKPVHFTVGESEHYDIPYWERFRSKELYSFNEILNESESDTLNGKWASHSYKDISLWPENVQKSINFNELGFDGVQDILFWFGTKGTNTPCHYDTYGFNIVVQIYGRKSWLLFPPGTNLNCTRIPYEESSVYCKQNFYSPSNMEEFGGKCISMYKKSFK